MSLDHHTRELHKTVVIFEVTHKTEVFRGFLFTRDQRCRCKSGGRDPHVEFRRGFTEGCSEKKGPIGCPWDVEDHVSRRSVRPTVRRRDPHRGQTLPMSTLESEKSKRPLPVTDTRVTGMYREDK